MAYNSPMTLLISQVRALRVHQGVIPQLHGLRWEFENPDPA